MTGELPISQALAEANPESLSELFDRDPEGYSEKDIIRIVKELIAQRQRFIMVQEAPKEPRTKGAKALKAQSTTLSPEDIGL